LLAAQVAVDGDQLVMPTLSVLHFVPVWGAGKVYNVVVWQALMRVGVTDVMADMLATKGGMLSCKKCQSSLG